MPSQLTTNRTLALAVSAVGILSACGIGERYNGPAPPPPPPIVNVTFSPARLNFAGAAPKTSSRQNIVLTNNESVPVKILLVYPVQDRAFAAESESCQPRILLPAHGTCTITVVFHPPASGSFRDQIVVYFENYREELIPVSGQATLPH